MKAATLSDDKCNNYRGWRGTKAQLVLLTLVLGTAALFAGKLSGEVWGAYVVGVVLAYVAGDVGSRWTEARYRAGKPPSEFTP